MSGKKGNAGMPASPARKSADRPENVTFLCMEPAMTKMVKAIATHL